MLIQSEKGRKHVPESKIFDRHSLGTIQNFANNQIQLHLDSKQSSSKTNKARLQETIQQIQQQQELQLQQSNCAVNSARKQFTDRTKSKESISSDENNSNEQEIDAQLQIQLGNYTHEIFKLSKKLQYYLNTIIDLFNNEQKVVEALNEIINKYQKDNSSFKSVAVLRDIFLAQNLKRLKQQPLTPQFLANNLAKQPAVKTYDLEGNLIMPKMNTDALKDLKSMLRDFKEVIYQKKLLKLHAFERQTYEHINEYEVLKEKFLNKKPHLERIAILQKLRVLEGIRSILGPTCPNFNLCTYIDIFHKKFQFCRNIDFDRNERTISGAIEQLVENLRSKFVEDDDKKKIKL